MVGLGDGWSWLRFRIIVEGQYNIRQLNESVPSGTPIGQSIPIPWKHNDQTTVEAQLNADNKTYTLKIY